MLHSLARTWATNHSSIDWPAYHHVYYYLHALLTTSLGNGANSQDERYYDEPLTLEIRHRTMMATGSKIGYASTLGLEIRRRTMMATGSKTGYASTLALEIRRRTMMATGSITGYAATLALEIRRRTMVGA